ncbi:MAG: tyrosine-type recombinase/integrase [Desulfuromonadaceae bacterium]|nr:tyrosine-type recombinase/integrase [Desulfuromonadaceae bacterium]
MDQREYLQVVGADYQPVIVRPTLAVKDAELLMEIEASYVGRRVGSLRQKESSVRGDLAQVHSLMEFSGKAPWMWAEEDFENWCAVLGMTKKVAIPTQRKYQSAIRNFLDYIINNVKYKNEIYRRYGYQPVQICHSENCIPHIYDRELTKERQPLSHDQISTFFNNTDELIEAACKFGAKDFRPLQRDKALFFIVYAGGLRASEAIGLNLGSFQPNPNFPEFSDFGYISVWGKGSKGSGPKHRMVPVTHALLPQLLQWYIEHIRPCFLKNADANEQALFLSERGKRMSLSTFEERFQHIINLVGLGGLGFTPHCLRHSSVTHESLIYSTEAVRIMHGHTFASTTQGYNHIPDEFVRHEINKGISSHLDAIQQLRK